MLALDMDTFPWSNPRSGWVLYLPEEHDESRDEVIEKAYNRLAHLASLLPTHPEARSAYDEQLRTLRLLQEEEASELREALRAERSLTPEMLAAGLARARELLARRDDAAGTNDPT